MTNEAIINTSYIIPIDLSLNVEVDIYEEMYIVYTR